MSSAIWGTGLLMIICGVVVALGIGLAIVPWFLTWVRRASGVASEPEGKKVPSWITGTFERALAFTLTVTISEFQTVALILGAWMTAKLAANWQRQPIKEYGSVADERVRIYTISALMAGTLSLALGVAGGEIARRGTTLLGLTAP